MLPRRGIQLTFGTSDRSSPAGIRSRSKIQRVDLEQFAYLLHVLVLCSVCYNYLTPPLLVEERSLIFYLRGGVWLIRVRSKIDSIFQRVSLRFDSLFSFDLYQIQPNQHGNGASIFQASFQPFTPSFIQIKAHHDDPLASVCRSIQRNFTLHQIHSSLFNQINTLHPLPFKSKLTMMIH